MVSIAESPSERVKRYLVQALKNEYGTSAVTEKDIPQIGTFTTPLFEVLAGPGKVNALGWATVDCIVKSAMRNASGEDAYEDTNDLMADVARVVRENVKRKTPTLSGLRPPWLSVTFTPVRKISGPTGLVMEITFTFQTGITIGGY